MKICPSCQISYDDAQKFCSNCGAPLTEQPEQPAPETPSALELPVTPEETIAAEEAAAAEERPAEEPVPELPPEEPKKPEKDKKKVGVGRRILAVLLSILLFVFLLTPALGYACRRATTEQGLTAILEDLNLAGLQAAPFFEDVDEELTLSELLSEDLGRVGLKIGESSVAKILNSSGMKGYLASQLSRVCADVYRGRTSFEFDPQTLRDELLEGKTSRVIQKEKITLDGEEADKVVKLLTDYGMADALSRDTLKDELPAVERGMNLGLSYVTIIVLLVLALGLIVLIFRTDRWNAGYWLGDVGGTALAVGLVLTLAAGLAKILPRVWQGICGGHELAALAGGGVLIHNVGVSLIVLGAGLVLAILGRLLRGRRKKEPAGE